MRKSRYTEERIAFALKQADQATLSGLQLLIDPRNITMVAPGAG